MILPMTITGHVVGGPALGRTPAGKPRVAFVVKDAETSVVWLALAYTKPDRLAAAAVDLGDAITVHGRGDTLKRTMDVRQLGVAPEPSPARLVAMCEGG
jgi:hypothetical protein